MKLEFSRQIFEKNKAHISSLIKIHLVELFDEARRTDRLTDMRKLIVAFRNFANAIKNTWNEAPLGIL
jgi:hypothetical protein